MDSTLGLHPFVTVDKIISNIPLAGWIIAGREKSTITMYYKIYGPLKNPEVEAVPISGMGKKILGIFERIFTAPIKGMGTDKEEKKKMRLNQGNNFWNRLKAQWYRRGLEHSDFSKNSSR